MGEEENGKMRKYEGEKWTAISLPIDLYEETKRWAELWGCTTEEFIIEALKKAIEEEKGKR